MAAGTKLGNNVLQNADCRKAKRGRGEGVLVQAAKERADCRLQSADGRSPMRSDVAGLPFPPK